MLPIHFCAITFVAHSLKSAGVFAMLEISFSPALIASGLMGEQWMLWARCACVGRCMLSASCGRHSTTIYYMVLSIHACIETARCGAGHCLLLATFC